MLNKISYIFAISLLANPLMASGHNSEEEQEEESSKFKIHYRTLSLRTPNIESLASKTTQTGEHPQPSQFETSLLKTNKFNMNGNDRIPDRLHPTDFQTSQRAKSPDEKDLTASRQIRETILFADHPPHRLRSNQIDIDRLDVINKDCLNSAQKRTREETFPCDMQPKHQNKTEIKLEVTNSSSDADNLEQKKKLKPDTLLKNLNQTLNDLADETIKEKKDFKNNILLAHKTYSSLKAEHGSTLDLLIKKLSYSLAIQLLSTPADKSILIHRLNQIRNIAWDIYNNSNQQLQKHSLISLLIILDHGLHLNDCHQEIDRKSLMVFCYYISNALNKLPYGTNIYEPPHCFLLSSGAKILQISKALETNLSPQEKNASKHLETTMRGFGINAPSNH